MFINFTHIYYRPLPYIVNVNIHMQSLLMEIIERPGHTEATKKAGAEEPRERMTVQC
jgi:hypothetical protein